MRLFFNLLIATALMLAFNAMDWLSITSRGSRIELSHLTGPAIGSVMIIAVVLWLSSIIVGLSWGISTCLTFGLAFFAFPFIGGLILWLTAHFMPDTLDLHGFWLTVLCGWLLLVVKIPAKRRARMR